MKIDDLRGTTAAQVKKLLLVIEALRQAIEAAGPDGIPSGHLYAAAMGHGVDLALYERCVALLVEAGRVRESKAHVLTHV